METPITRRSAIRAGTLSAIGVGLMTAAGAPPVAAATALPVLADVVNFDDLEAECQRLHADVVQAAQDACNYDGTDDAAINKYWDLHQEWLVAEIGRHLPGLYPVIRLLHQHVTSVSYQNPGACCTVAAGFEP